MSDAMQDDFQTLNEDEKKICKIRINLVSTLCLNQNVLLILFRSDSTYIQAVNNTIIQCNPSLKQSYSILHPEREPLPMQSKCK